MSKQIKIAILADGKQSIAEFKNVGSASRMLGDQAETTTSRLKAMGDSLDAAGRKMMKTGRSMTLGVSLPIIAGLGAMIKAAEESNKIAKISEQIIKNTGQVAGVTAGDLGKLSMAISRKTGVDDEAIQSSQNLLLSFTKIRNSIGENNDVFNRASQASVDMSTVFGSLDGAAKGLGKALEDPIKGLGALGKAGVKFSDDQKIAMKTMVESGDLLGAQQIILGEVESKFKGVAENSATAVDKMKNNIGNMAETLGNVLVPFLEKASKKVSEWTEKFQELSPKMQKFIVVGLLIAAAIGPVVTVLGAVAVALGVLLSPIGLAVVAVGLIAAAFVTAYRKSETFRDIVDGVVNAVKGFVGGLATAAKLALGGEWGKAWDKAVETVREFGSKIKAAFDGVKWGELWDKVFEGAKDLAAKIPPIVEGWKKKIVSAFQAVDWSDLGIAILKALREALEFAGREGVPIAQKIARTLFEKMIPGGGGSDLGKNYSEYMKSKVYDPGQVAAAAAGASWAQGLVRGMSTGTAGAASAGSRMGEAARNGIGSGNGAGLAWASSAIAGMVNGLMGGIGRVTGAAGAVAAAAFRAGMKAQESKSPSRKWYEMGEFAVEGMALGIEAREPRATTAAAKASKNVTYAFWRGLKDGAASIAAAAQDMMKAVDDSVSAVLGKYNAGKSTRGAERDLAAATKELGDVRRRNDSLPGRIADAERKLADALAGGEETVKDVTDAQRDLDELRRESVSSASDLERAELALEEASDRLNDAKLAAYKAENDLAAQGPDAIQRWRDYASAAGLAADQIERVARAMGGAGAGAGGGGMGGAIVPPDLTGAGNAADEAAKKAGYKDLIDYWMRTGGYATSGSAAVTVPPMIVPPMVLNVYGSVTTERDLVEAVRTGLVRGADQGYQTFAPV